MNNFKHTIYLNKTLKRLDPPLVEDILLEKTQNGLGFSISGGLFTEHIFNDNGIFITKIIKGGAADLDGRLNVGDRLLSVNIIHSFHLFVEIRTEKMIQNFLFVTLERRSSFWSHFLFHITLNASMKLLYLSSCMRNVKFRNNLEKKKKQDTT